ncbi:hypothetical protein PPERSA_08149 [Pseudocohnilembus persalinus]|uniref:Uncharacterized protein n=1 Tax=Pseudocohnilembus persalinus TaxID=266149 RepID=A0A0V0R362_PSEPJ|nr:hypothetical protein PPERSA_08149 [Pseudocohnilembus persalinus]|eukprot:KRX08946.1 hypothetical protein PPERSA_08149 [Pseudocohnilembus persalinus]
MSSFIENIAKITSQNSLLNSGENKNQVSFEEIKFAENLQNIIQPGDIIITKTPTTVYNIVRKLTKSEYDHVSIVLDKQNVIHIAPPQIRLINSQIFLTQKHKPIIIRANLSENQINDFLQNLMSQQNLNYDYNECLKLLGLKFLNNFVVLEKIPNITAQSSIIYKKKICSDLVFYCLAMVSQEFKNCLQNYVYDLDFYKFGNFSPDDLIILFCKDKSKLFSLVHGEQRHIQNVKCLKLQNEKKLKKKKEIKKAESLEEDDDELIKLLGLTKISTNLDHKQNQQNIQNQNITQNDSQNQNQNQNQFNEKLLKSQLKRFQNEAQIILDNYNQEGHNFFVKTKSLVDKFLVLANYNKFFTFPFINKLVQQQISKQNRGFLNSQLFGYQEKNISSNLWQFIKVNFIIFEQYL